MMQLISPYLTTNISSNCKFDMIEFEQSWKLMQGLTIEDMHISPSFRFSVIIIDITLFISLWNH